MTLKCELYVTQGHYKWYHFKAWVRFPIRLIVLAVCVAVCDIFSVKEWPDLENRVRVRSMSLEMARIG